MTIFCPANSPEPVNEISLFQSLDHFLHVSINTSGFWLSNQTTVSAPFKNFVGVLDPQAIQNIFLNFTAAIFSKNMIAQCVDQCAHLIAVSSSSIYGQIVFKRFAVWMVSATVYFGPTNKKLL